MQASFKFKTTLKVSAVFFSALLAAFSVSASDYKLAPYKISYLLERGDITVGIGDFELKTDGDNYLYSSAARAKGFLAKIILGDKVITEYSAGTITDGIPRPRSYRYNQGEDDKRNQIIDFNWLTNQAEASYKFKTEQVPLIGEVHDKLSMQLAAMQAVAKGAEAGELEFKVVDRRDLDTYNFSVVGKQPVKVNGTSYSAVVLKRQASDREATFWVAPQLGYAIVKFEQKKEDDPVIRLTMRSIEGTPLVKR